MRAFTAVSWRKNDAEFNTFKKDDSEDGQDHRGYDHSAAVKPLWPIYFY